MSRSSFGERSFAGEQEQRGYGQGQFTQGQYGQGQYGQSQPMQGQYGGQGRYGGQSQFEQRGWPQAQQGFGPDPRFSQESQLDYGQPGYWGQQGNFGQPGMWGQQGNWGQQEQRATPHGQPGYGQMSMVQPDSQMGSGTGFEQTNFPQSNYPQGNGGRGNYGQWGRVQPHMARAELSQWNYARDPAAAGYGYSQIPQTGARGYAGQFSPGQFPGAQFPGAQFMAGQFPQRSGWQLQQDLYDAQRTLAQAQQILEQNWAQGGAPAGQFIRGPFAGRGPKGYKRSDERINEDVSDRLAQNPNIDASEIELRVSNAEVTLTGNVDSRWAKRLAEDLTEEVPGVREIHNQLRVVQPAFGQQASQQVASERSRERESARQPQAAGRS